MKEELTSKMHMEFCKDEEERLELAAMAVFADVKKGKSKEIALKEYNITADQYEAYKP